MRYSGRTERDEDGPWFELGRVEVTTSVLILLVWVATLVIWAIEPPSKPITNQLVLVPSDVTSGEVWRLITWPWAHLSFDLGDVISAAIFLIFGMELEKQLGRKPFTVLMGASLLIIGLSAVVLSTVLGQPTILYDLALPSLAVLLLYVAEHPLRPFFFGIPAWVIGAVIVALELVNDISDRDWVRMLTVIVAAALISLVARKVGLLSMYERIPEVSLPARKNREEGGGRAERKRRKGTGASDVARRTGLGADQGSKKRSGSLWGKRKEEEPAEIVQMPPQRRRPVDTSVPNVSADDLALDALLDKIADGGLDALTPAERQELADLRERRRSR